MSYSFLAEREFFLDDLLVRIHLIIDMILVDRPRSLLSGCLVAEANTTRPPAMLVPALFTVTQVNRGLDLALRRSTLEFCLGGWRS